MKHKKSAIIVLVLVVLIGAAAFVGYQFFRVEKITVVGNERYTPEEIIELSGVQYNTNIFMVDENAIRERFTSSPVVVFTKLVRKYPNEIELHVRERQETAIVPYMGAYLVTDEELVVMANGEAQDAEQYPTIEGMNVTSFQLGEILQVEDEYQVKAAERLLIALEGTSLSIKSIDVTNTSSVTLTTREGMVIKVGNMDDIEKRLEKAVKILEILNAEGKTTGTLDVTSSNGGSYMP